MSQKAPGSVRLVATLGGIAILSGVLVVMTYQLTKPRIEENKRVALEKAVFAVLDGAVSKKNFRLEGDRLTALADGEGGANVFAGYRDEGKTELVGFAMEAAARGYQDVVKILYGYNPETECVIGMTVLQSTETPGLGDQIEKDPGFLANFDCLEARVNAEGDAVENPIVTVKNGKKMNPWELDGISGATVTSKAVGDGLRESTGRMLPGLRKALAGGQP